MATPTSDATAGAEDGSALAPLYDCHCHLQAEEFDSDRDEVIERAGALSRMRRES